MFQAARTALASVGIERAQWSHGALHATFATELVRRRKVYPLLLVHALTEAMERRHMADYSGTQISIRRATRTVHAAEDFVSGVMEAVDMHDPTPAAPDRRALVDHYIREFSRLAQKHCPEADIEVLSAPYEDEDAHIVVVVPQEIDENAIDRLGAILTKRSTEVLLDTGILILAGVYEVSEYPKADHRQESSVQNPD